MRHAILLGAALALGLALSIWHASLDEGSAPQRRPDFTLTAADGTAYTASQWDGQLLLVNFWASWCTPCIKEIPLLVDAQTRYADAGLQVIGPALDDAEAASEMAQQLGVNYPVMPGDTAIATLMDALGDTHGALPFTVLIDRGGHIVERHWGALDEPLLQDWIATHL